LNRGEKESKKTGFKKINITLPMEIFDRLEHARGLVPRSRLIARVLEKHLAEEV
jgi:metal-responsive CopG/Arc/MetJ family transcriptional regulator